MRTVELPDFKVRVEDVLREVAEQRESVEVVDGGRVLARIVPAEVSSESQAWLRRWKQLAAEIGQQWPAGVSALVAVREQRRELCSS